MQRRPLLGRARRPSANASGGLCSSEHAIPSPTRQEASPSFRQRFRRALLERARRPFAKASGELRRTAGQLPPRRRAQRVCGPCGACACSGGAMSCVYTILYVCYMCLFYVHVCRSFRPAPPRSACVWRVSRVPLASRRLAWVCEAGGSLGSTAWDGRLPSHIARACVLDQQHATHSLLFLCCSSAPSTPMPVWGPLGPSRAWARRFQCVTRGTDR